MVIDRVGAVIGLQLYINNTSSNAQDPGKAPGWSIGDSSLYRDWDSSGSWTSFNDPKKIRVKGINPRVNNASISIADASAAENASHLLFDVTLSRSLPDTVKVDFETISGGTATEGDDYHARRIYTHVILAGDRTAQMGFALIEDMVNEQPDETVKVRLSNARVVDAYGNVRSLLNITTAEATGTITAPTTTTTDVPGLTIGIRDATGDEGDGWLDFRVRLSRKYTDYVCYDFETISGGSATEGTDYLKIPKATYWMQIGKRVDKPFVRLIDDLMNDNGETEGSYRLSGAENGSKAGTVESTLTGVYPYAQLELNAKVSAWALAGAGSGELTLHQDGGKPMPTDISMRMGAVGFKGKVLDGTGASKLAMNLKSDAMWVGTKSERTSDMVATQGDVTRLRVILEGERAFDMGGGATFTPSAEIGLRHDGGDAETGTGLEVGAGVSYVTGPLTVEGQVRMLVAHEESGYEEWGASAAMRITPSASGRGLTLSIAPQWGRTGSATQRLWSARDASALGAHNAFEANNRLSIDAGYGFALVHGHGVLTPYAGLTLGDGGTRTMRTGMRWQVAPDAVFGLEGTQRADSAGEGDNEVRLRATLRF